MRDNKLKAIYNKLYAYFGPQHWWPAKTPFEVMLGAILTQNTSWANVEKAIGNLKKQKLLSPGKIYKLSHTEVASLIKPAGYYNIKAKRLMAFLDFFFKNFQASVKKMSSYDTMKLREMLLSVHGIGQETADSILLYALGKPVFVIDAYTKRILFRHRLVSKNATYNQIQDLFIKNIKNDSVLFNEYHALLVRLGKEFCLKNKPKCEICPLKNR